MGLLHLCDEHPAVVRPDTSAADAIRIMLEHRVGAVTVVDDQGRLIAMLSIRNLLQWRVDELTERLDTMEQYMTNDAPGG
ncbi:MAG: CBS domain-containing protein [Terriglobales bacterium]|jgi:CBS domain-containing protein